MTPENPTRQDVINDTWTHYYQEENPPAVNKHGDPMFVTEDGNCCAAGRFLTEGMRETLKGVAAGDQISIVVKSAFPQFEGLTLNQGFCFFEEMARALHDDPLKNGELRPQEAKANLARLVHEHPLFKGLELPWLITE